jgi:hypothetical protein
MSGLRKFFSRCIQCKPVEEFPSYFDKKRQKARVRAACKACMNQRSAIWRAHNPGYHAAYNAKYKAAKLANRSTCGANYSSGS